MRERIEKMPVTIKGGFANAKTSLMIQLPIPMRVKLEELAEEQGVPTGSLARNLIAESLGFDLPVTQRGRARKYETDEARKAAQQARDKARRDNLKQGLEAS